MTKAKTVGTSRAARFTIGNRRTGRMETVDFRGVTALRRERQRAAEEVDQHIQGFSRETRRMIAELRDEVLVDNVNNTDEVNGGNDMDWEPLDMIDDDTIMAGMREMFQQYRYGWTRSSRTWRDRRERLWLNWKPQLPSLCAAYMDWKYSAASFPSSSPCPLDDARGAAPTPPPSAFFQIEVIDIYTLDNIVSIPYTEEQTV
ncbi:hypothetical protein CCMSSC00406_0005963 [Pleurotus cornucopiae]|uniref:Uncharacterized protein n=1 Tax=Pleurotus cornucopiae TaxID=5321 RepID=A0ACB7IP45_PLECO|nr:hypothetical protein CCMSSC00406_0005963 [Pleurotus cornucopiae]